jgi:hypothetical protein
MNTIYNANIIPPKGQPITKNFGTIEAVKQFIQEQATVFWGKTSVYVYLLAEYEQLVYHSEIIRRPITKKLHVDLLKLSK